VHPMYVLYVARLADDWISRQHPDRCCTDVPRSVADGEPMRPRRSARKLTLAVPASASVFRHALKNPLRLTEVSPGDVVVTPRGKEVGRVSNVYLAPGSLPAIAFAPADPLVLGRGGPPTQRRPGRLDEPFTQPSCLTGQKLTYNPYIAGISSWR
jgi:hypothetical protein